MFLHAKLINLWRMKKFDVYLDPYPKRLSVLLESVIAKALLYQLFVSSFR